MFRRNFEKKRWNLQTRPGPNSPELFSSVRKRIKYFLIFSQVSQCWTVAYPAAQQCCREISRRVLESQEWNDIPSHRRRRTVSEKKALFSRTWDQEWDESYVPGREPNGFLDLKKVRWDPAVRTDSDCRETLNLNGYQETIIAKKHPH